MPNQETVLKVAKKDILQTLHQSGKIIFRFSDLSDILAANRESWRLSSGTTTPRFIEFLLEYTPLQAIALDLPNSRETRYTLTEIGPLDLAAAIVPSAYLSHYTAVYLHGLTDIVPTELYINREQSPKPKPTGELTQASIDRAFRNKQRFTNNCAVWKDTRYCILSSKHSGQLGVVEGVTPSGMVTRITDLERTLIDITVRPEYAGGVFEVMKSYRAAVRAGLSVNRIAHYLDKLDYVYPYEQAVGFYLETARLEDPKRLLPLRRSAIEFDFYAAHHMGETSFDASWRIYYPTGLK